MRTRAIITRLLLAFVLVSVGFAVGREVERQRPGAAPAAIGAATQPAGEAPAAAEKVIVYYMHTTFRCVTCNRIEAQTDSVLRSGFATELAAGRLEWKIVNFQEREDLAKRYGVGTSTVVVVKMRGGQEVSHSRLDDVWTKVNDADGFARYVGDAIRGMMKGGGV